ncbi:MAG TPA: hypothetical protein VI072_21695 [Polyangiaceae bacterium]
MRLILDSGALVALERNDRAMWRRFKAALLASQIPVSHGGVVGQVWRGRGPRQALLGKALAGIDVRGLDEELGRAAGTLLGQTRKSDVIDAAIVLLAEDGDQIVTSDPNDLEVLAAASGRHVELIRT